MSTEITLWKVPRFLFGGSMEVGNILRLGWDWAGNEESIVQILVLDCILTCRRMGIEPMGALRMSMGTDLFYGDFVMYAFTPDE